MIKSGLASISFRKLDCVSVAKLAASAGLHGIEWIGDAHVPAGDVRRAREATVATSDAGLVVAGYGSYFRAGEKRDDLPEFPLVLESAVALGTPVIRAWAGLRPSIEADSAYRSKVLKDLLDAGERASKAGIKIALEYHSKTLTDSDESALSLMKELEGSNVYFYWQPRDHDVAVHMALLPKIRHRLVNVHVFNWLKTPEGFDRRPLDEGYAEWVQYLSVPDPEKTCFALLEFVRGDEPEQLVQDAKALNMILDEIANASEK